MSKLKILVKKIKKDCWTCSGTGKVNKNKCPTCKGTGDYIDKTYYHIYKDRFGNMVAWDGDSIK